MNKIIHPEFKTITYTGERGLFEITRNSLKTKNLYIYEVSYASLNTLLNKNEAENFRLEYLKNKVKIKEITNFAFHENYTEINDFHEKCMEIRYIRKDRLAIETEFLVYDNVVAFYYMSDQFYGVEIYDENFAKMQKNIFMSIWNQAEKPIVGNNGKSSMF